LLLASQAFEVSFSFALEKTLGFSTSPSSFSDAIPNTFPVKESLSQPGP
jgi:hypothetical protein